MLRGVESVEAAAGREGAGDAVDAAVVRARFLGGIMCLVLYLVVVRDDA